MLFVDSFKNSLLPGNYALTKSMELNKVSSSGTLWYTKKFLTLYYFIFLSNKIMTREYVNEVIGIFDNYIDGLDESIKPIAEEFFYPSENSSINFKSKDFNMFTNFANCNSFENQEDMQSYYQKAKKFYFSLLMGSGGQTGIKKKLKAAIQAPGFVYTDEIIEKIILGAAVDSCMRDINAFHDISDNSIKYIISEEAIEDIKRLSADRAIDEADIYEAIRVYPNENPKYHSIANDMIAFIRNERQVLYYYGYFHSKSSGAVDFEFSSLTPVGDLALTANALEFLAIWEHQKIKMISQPPTVSIEDIPSCGIEHSLFEISYNPYVDIIGHMVRRNELSIKEYKYVVSRKKHTISEDDWEIHEDDIFNSIDDIIEIVTGFNRKGDNDNNDGIKELKKYMLGLLIMNLDNSTNPLGVISYTRRTGYNTYDVDKLSLIFEIYSKLSDYKIIKYGNLFNECELDLRTRYKSGTLHITNQRTKINWDLYNIHADKFILLSEMLCIAMASLGNYQISAFSKQDIVNACEYMMNHFRNLLSKLGIKSGNSIKKEIGFVLHAINTCDYSRYCDSEENHEEILAKYKNDNSVDLRVKIEDVSKTSSVGQNDERKRNMNLISMLKSYYIIQYSNENYLKCECCGEETFITHAGEPYVEFHHLIPFGIAYGPDHYLNLFALCPNCHMKMHYLCVEEKEYQYEQLNVNNYLNKNLVERLLELKNQNLLRSYHLEYLLADNAITLDEYESIAA